MADAEQFERTAIPYLDVVYRTAVALCKDGQHAEDLVQLTYVKALEKFETFREGTNARAWLLRILRNTWLDELRHKRVVGVQLPADEQRLEAGLATEAEPQGLPGAEDLLESFTDEQVIHALRELPESQRLALFLADVEGLSQEEIAEILGVAVGTIKSRTSRARGQLRDRLYAHAKDLGFLRREK